MLTTFWDLLQRSEEMFEGMAQRLVAQGGEFRCLCGHTKPLGDADAVKHYLQHGWPKHHDQTMPWHTQASQSEDVSQ